MAKYLVFSSEWVYYATEVEANSEQEAMDKIANGEIGVGEPTDGDHFEVNSAELVA